MRIWRDIISRQAWNNVVLPKADGSTARQSPVGAVANLRAVFERSLSSKDAALRRITMKIEAYHSIDKTVYRNIDGRIAALKEISALANDFMRVFKVDAAAAADRSGATKNKFFNSYRSSDPSAFTFDRHMLTLARRSLRKAAYLKTLKAYYAVGGGGYAYRTPQSLLALFNGPQERTGEFVGLTPHVRLEQLDPVHRSNFEGDDEGSCGYAFELWAKDPRQDKPFFMWLEGSMVCVADDKATADAQSVPYERMDQRRQSSISQQRIVLFPAPLKAFDLDHPDRAPVLCSTATYQCASAKDPLKGFGQGMAAYVWTEEGELFIAQHGEHIFHHSSFVSGRRVRCAGMIKIDQGRVAAISNNSGHYRPSQHHLLNLVRFLQGAGAFKSDAVVKCQAGSGRDYSGSPAGFLAG